MSLETKQRVMQRAISNCPLVTLDIQGKGVPFLLDLGSMVTLIWEGYFEKNILPLLKTSPGELTEAHSLFRLSAANNGVMPGFEVFWFFRLTLNTLLGFCSATGVLGGFLIVKDPNTLLSTIRTSTFHSTVSSSGVIGCNLICLWV